MEERSIEGIERLFADHFSRWGLRLPPGALERKEPGSVTGDGWHIRFVFGSDECGDYLDYYASHRMTNAHHVRLRATGEVEALPAPWEFYGYDGTEEDRLRQQERFFAHNRRVHALLREKGLLE